MRENQMSSLWKIELSGVLAGAVFLILIRHTCYLAGRELESSSLYIQALLVYRVLFPFLALAIAIAWIVRRKNFGKGVFTTGIHIFTFLFVVSDLMYTWMSSPSSSFARGFWDQLQSDVEPAQLQAWAVDLIRTHDVGKVSNSELPTFVPHSLHVRPQVNVGSHSDYRTVSITYGGGFFAWGMVVGDTNLVFDPPIEGCQKWRPGIYVCVE